MLTLTGRSYIRRTISLVSSFIQDSVVTRGANDQYGRDIGYVDCLFGYLLDISPLSAHLAALHVRRPGRRFSGHPRLSCLPNSLW